MRLNIVLAFMLVLATTSSVAAQNKVVEWSERSYEDSLLELTDNPVAQESVEMGYQALLSFDDLASYLGSETLLMQAEPIELATDNGMEPSVTEELDTVEIPIDFVKDASAEEIRNYKPTSQSIKKVIDAGMVVKHASSMSEIVAINSTQTSNSELLRIGSGKKSDDGLWISRNRDGSLNTKIAVPLKSSPLTASVDGIRVDRSSRIGGLTVVKARIASDFDPFKVLISWKWHSLTVGEAIQRIGSFVGYNVVVSDRSAQRVYALPLPGSHRVVSGINAQTGLELLAGPAFTVVVNHKDRTISHRLKPRFARSPPLVLPPCPEDATFATHAGIGVWSVGGMKCSFQ